MRQTLSFFLLLTALRLFAQAPPTNETAKPAFVSPAARLAAAKTALVRNAGGTEIPFNVISAGLDGWGRFRMVDERSEADILIEVLSPADENASTSSKSHVSSGRVESPTPAYDPSHGAIRLSVYDARTHIVLWSASEQPKGGFRQRTRDDHLVESAERLLRKFRDRLEPPPPEKTPGPPAVPKQ